jgi:hypothetical protein
MLPKLPGWHDDYFYADTSEIGDGVHLNQRGQDSVPGARFRP